MSDQGGSPGAGAGAGAGAGKPEEPASTEHLNIKVTDNNNEVFFKIKRTTALKKLMDAFCERQGKAPNTVRFLMDGNRVQPGDSPNSVCPTPRYLPPWSSCSPHPLALSRITFEAARTLSADRVGVVLQLGMEDGDTLEVHQEQTGGA